MNKLEEGAAQLILAADNLQAMMRTTGWSEVVYPMLKEMIFDITGGERDGVFRQGRLNSKTPVDEISRLIGYKEGLVDFWNNIVTTIYEAEKTRKDIKSFNEKQQNEQK